MASETLILHSDLNCYYASVEMNEHPELRGKKIAVCGSTENRHGIVLTASYPAKRCGVRTGMANWQARQMCPDLIMVEPHYDLYLRYSRIVRSIYHRYADCIEPFGMDECWISIPCCPDLETDGRRLAEEIRRTVREETGLTVSIGVSFTKILAKLGSDMKKPDAVTVVSRGNYRDTAWKLPVSDLLYVGPATRRRLQVLNIHTIGDLAKADPALLRVKLGRNGILLWHFANGTDGAPVMPQEYEFPVKSIGHGVTCVRDLETDDEVWLVLLELAQDVGHRLRVHELTAGAVQVSVRDRELGWYQWQAPLPYPSQSPLEITQAGYALFLEHYAWDRPVRALTIRGIHPGSARAPVQTDLFHDEERRDRRRRLDDTVDALRGRFGERIVIPACLTHGVPVAQDRCETVPMPSPMFR